MRYTRFSFFAAAFAIMLCIIGTNSNATAQARRTQSALARETAVEQPLFAEYRGITLGMTAGEARGKLGTPQIQESDQDYYVLSDNERVQIAYNPAGKIVTISIDYLGGIGAPDHKAVVGGELEPSPVGGMYRMVRYYNAGFWVSYNRSAGPVVIVTITMQKM